MLSPFLSIVAYVHQDDWSLPRKPSQFSSFIFKWAKFKEIILKPETNYSPVTLVTSNLHASIAHILATNTHYLTSPFHLFSEPYPVCNYVEYLENVTTSLPCHLSSMLRSCSSFSCLWISDFSICSSVNSLQLVYIFLEVQYPNWANHSRWVVWQYMSNKLLHIYAS